MVQKLINISANQDINLKNLASNLGLSEDELIANILSKFLQENIVLNDPLEDFLAEAEIISQIHKLPKDYNFNRQEIYDSN
ncbi:hypothetical protein ACN4EE_02050 [Geminocystis sp. CENA526]|uniref:hypothetical protein n=1 Tax=Geminocystis sp. CENA526 TaxID=1355871 RepID=UPI003D6E7AF3